MRVVLVRRVNDFSPSSPGRKRVPNEFEVQRRQVRYRNGAFVCETFYSYLRSARASAISGCTLLELA